MLIDEITIIVKAGNGGDGKVAFRREKYVPRGGPWGGDGADGGNVYIEAINDIAALRRFRNKKNYHAEDGRPGGIAKKKGKKGEDLVLKVPVGTVVTDQKTSKVYDFNKVEEKILIARGGRGGRGNREFATATRQTPRFAEVGEKTQEKKISFELRLIADVGLIGLPNAGKTSLLNELTQASVKVGSYPFTTLEPNLGALDGLILADIPGLSQGASKGKGLGFKFLRHIARTRILVHCISVESPLLLKDYHIVRRELEEFDKELVSRNEIVLLTKTDLISQKEINAKIRQLKKTNSHVLPVSIYDWDKINSLSKFLLKFLNRK